MTYLNGKVCSTPNTTIANCMAYQSAAVCASCDWGYQLSSDKKSCSKVTLDDCLVVDSEATSKCSVCEDGK